MSNTPVLFLSFNRPDLTAQVFEAIRTASPSRLYVAGDGPRESHHTELSQIEQARLVATAVDWDCELHTLFRERNLGCRLGVSTAIDWFFEQEEEGIVLEDDCVPSQSFFRYCEELLDRYRDDKRIMCISGDNFQQGRAVTPYSYYFSKYNHCWGWASWRRAWAQYDRNMLYWPEFRDSRCLDAWSDGSKAYTRYWMDIFNTAAAGKVDTWDYQWTFSCWAQNGLTCLPRRNLVKNIGFDGRATHTKNSGGWLELLEAEELEFPLAHPNHVVRNVAADAFSSRVCFGIKEGVVPQVMCASWRKLRNFWTAHGIPMRRGIAKPS